MNGQWLGEWGGQWLGERSPAVVPAPAGGSGGGTSVRHWEAVARTVGRRVKKYEKAYLQRDGQILVFNSEEEKEEFLDAEEQAKQAITHAARRKVIATKPDPVVVDLKAVDQDLIAQQQYQQIIEDYFLQLEEEDIEMLLLLA